MENGANVLNWLNWDPHYGVYIETGCRRRCRPVCDPNGCRDVGTGKLIPITSAFLSVVIRTGAHWTAFAVNTTGPYSSQPPRYMVSHTVINASYITSGKAFRTLENMVMIAFL